jgi:hypothetical protein
MKHFTFSALALAALSAACGGQPSSPDSSASTDDGNAALTASRTLACTLEYETFAPTYASGYAGDFSLPFSTVKTSGATAGDSGFAFKVSVNPKPAYNLSFNATLSDASGEDIAYTVLPSPRTGGAYLFELGGRIAPVSRTGDDGIVHAFDHLRAYCSYK